MRQFTKGLAIVASLALAGCATLGSAGDVAQNLYRAHGLYNIALEGATTYSESSFASRPVVQAMTDANRKAKPAFEYSESAISCLNAATNGTPPPTVGKINCSALDLSAGAMSRNVAILQAAKSALLGLQKGAK